MGPPNASRCAAAPTGTRTRNEAEAVRRGAEYAFPTGDLEQMLSEIERGYQA